MLSLLVLMTAAELAAGAPLEPVNAVIGDRSAEGLRQPLSEQNRLKVHLAFVERALRARPTKHLSKARRAARLQVLDRLRDYHLRGEFPRNTYVDKRAPVFVDERGVRCAVGAIAEPDIGKGEVERIARHSRLAYVLDIDSPELLGWAKRNGLSLTELATIQPTYDHGGSVEMPQDPWPVKVAQRRLSTAWQTCRAEAYPANIGWGGERIGNTVTFRKAKGRLRASVALELVEKPEGSERNPAPSAEDVAHFLSCVQDRFEGGTYHRTDGVGAGTRYGLSVPAHGGPLVREDNGKLAESPASSYVLHKLEALQSTCRIHGKRYQVEAVVKADGRVETVRARPFRPRAGTTGQVENNSETSDRIGECIAKHLGTSLRFPASEHSTEIRVVGN